MVSDLALFYLFWRLDKIKSGGYTGAMDFIADWRDKGLLKPEQAAVLSDIESGRLMSISSELKSLLYLGALLIVAGVGGTVKRYVLELGPIAITLGLSSAFAASMYYCFTRGRPYAPDRVESPTPAFDYILYLGCAFLGILFGYLETHFHVLAQNWDYYMLGCAALFFWLAYRFDNRLVLAMGLMNLGAWFGVRFSHFDLPYFGLRARSLIFGSVVLLAGWWLENAERIKAHFADTYYNVGLHVLFWALLWGLFDYGVLSVYTVLVAALTAASINYALRRRSFQYFLYGVAYGYIGLSYCLLKIVVFNVFLEAGFYSLYFLLSSTAIMVLIFKYRRRLEQDA